MVLGDELSIASFSGGQHYANFTLTIENAPDGLLFAELQVPDERYSPLFMATPDDFQDVIKGVPFVHRRRGYSLEFRAEGDRVRVAYEMGRERASVSFLLSEYAVLLGKLQYERDQSPPEYAAHD